MGFESFWTSKLPDWLARLWRWFLDAWVLIRVSRFAILGLVILAGFMLGSDQGRELLLSIADRNPPRQHAPWFVLLITTFFAFNVWTWARLMVSYRYLPAERGIIDERRLAKTFDRMREAGRAPSFAFEAKRDEIPEINQPVISDDEMAEWMVRLPRVLGVLVYLITAGSLFMAYLRFGPSLGEESSYRLLVWSAVIAFFSVPFYLFVRYRRDIIEFVITRYLLPADPTGAPLPMARARERLADALVVKSQNDVRERWQWCAWPDLPANTKVYLLLLTGLLVATCVWGIADPGTFGRYFGSTGTLFFGLAFWMGVGTWALFWLDHRRFPIITAAFVWALVLNLFGDNHAVRVAEPEQSNTGSTQQDKTLRRHDVASVVADWTTRSMAKQKGDPSDNVVLRPVIVATAGGGIRAGYWTATVLGRLDRQVSEFRDNLFAISAVSGGGLGAAAYVAASTGAGCKDADGVPLGIAEATLAMLSDDFLAPTLSGLLYRDLVTRFIPAWFIPDRAQALESAWEHAWATTCPQSAGAFSDPFLDLWPGEGYGPALLINGTMVQTGRRIITSNLLVHPEVFTEAHDFYDYFDRGDVRLSTAVHNGARFTYVSPAGTLSAKLGPSAKANREVTGQIIDGGYFENFGADTATDLLVALMNAMRKQAGPDIRIHPVVIQISSDPRLNAIADYDKSALSPSPDKRHSETFVPLVGIANTRGARGINAMKRLHRTTEETYGGTFAHFRLCVFEKLEEPPLGWVLSEAARDTIAKHFELACETPVRHDNALELQRLHSAFE
jgi:hypothetical protein